MNLTDEEFREEYKPLQVPAHFDATDTQENQMIYALAQVGEGTVEEIIAELEKLNPGFSNEQTKTFVRVAMKALFEKGHLTGAEKGGVMHYNLSKITQANDGATNPDLLAPGLD
jgi:hypothetical protein